MSAPLSFSELARGLGWGGKRMVGMTWAYFDESGEHNKDGHLTRLTLGGAIAPVDAWNALCPAWSKVLTDAGVRAFHMTDFEAREPPFNWENDKRRQVLNDLLDLALAHVSEFVGFVGQPEQGKAAFIDAYETDIAKATRSLAIHTYHSQEPLTVVFAKHKEFKAARIGRYFDLWSEGDGRLTFGGVGDPNDLAPLQVADIVAYEISRSSRSTRPENERYPFRRLAPKMRPITYKLINQARIGAANAWVRQ